MCLVILPLCILFPFSRTPSVNPTSTIQPPLSLCKRHLRIESTPGIAPGSLFCPTAPTEPITTLPTDRHPSHHQRRPPHVATMHRTYSLRQTRAPTASQLQVSTDTHTHCFPSLDCSRDCRCWLGPLVNGRNGPSRCMFQMDADNCRAPFYRTPRLLPRLPSPDACLARAA